ncbi:hypothetical protein L6279_00680 [Candidatus Parcubacteria bacterium]|nr:hypothetical protein [Candidatus Parcubacteria bacterium]
MAKRKRKDFFADHPSFMALVVNKISSGIRFLLKIVTQIFNERKDKLFIRGREKC